MTERAVAFTRPSAAAAAAEPPQYVLVPGHGTGKQIKAYHVAANPNHRQTKEHEPIGWPRGTGQRSSNAKKKKKKEKNAESSSGAGRGRKKILSIDYQSTFGRRNKKQKQELMPRLSQAVLGNTRRRRRRSGGK